MAFPHRNVRPIATTASIFDTASPPYGKAKKQPIGRHPAATGRNRDVLLTMKSPMAHIQTSSKAVF
jgi:hypothetical protein